MHFFKTSVSFIAVLCAFGAAYSATSSRVSVTAAAAAASRRLPVLSNLVKTGGSTTTSTSGTSSSSSSSSGTILLSNADCIEDYRDCMKADNACGSEFEECTTNVLFHGHMGECFSTLYQCPNAAVESLFGTSNIGALSDVESYVEDTQIKDKSGNVLDKGEVARYKYPTDGSIMGIDIIGAATRNKLSTADCVKKYKRCLSKDTICGEDFELCTSKQEFKKQAVLCDSTLARCQKEGFQQIFGAAVTTKPANKKLEPNGDGDAAKWIEEGATLAATNAVNTCYKLVDNCFMNACAKNPYHCIEGVKYGVMGSADFVADQSEGAGNVNFTKFGEDEDGNLTRTVDEQTGIADVRKFFRAACEETIGANKYCQMTFLGRMPKKSELQGEDAVELYEEIFDDAYATRNNKNTFGEKITQLIEKFDTAAKNKCIDTFKSCAVRSCGGGSGAVCYSRVFAKKDKLLTTAADANTTNTINGENTYNDIKAGCEGVVNMDANCIYMAAVQGTSNGTTGTYNYTFSSDGNNGAFATLFPKASNGTGNLVRAGNTQTIVVTALNADLQAAYNDVAIEQMKKQCSNVVTNCVKSMCGKDYQNCYRNRDDISIKVYGTGDNSFDKSMNKVGGVLDYTIVQGLCVNTIKNSDACAESLAIAKAELQDGTADVTASWGDDASKTLSSAWHNSARAVKTSMTQATDENGRKQCTCSDGSHDICADEKYGNPECTKAYMVPVNQQFETAATATLFQSVLADIEREVQSLYMAKLTKEQNICLAQNTGANPNPAFVWAKYSGDKRPNNYATYGLGSNTTMGSNDLYNSFCRVKVTLSSEDKEIQKVLDDRSFTFQNGLLKGLEFKGFERDVYFVVGDPFTCGSWLSGEVLDDIAAEVAKSKTGTDAEGKLSSGQKWGVAGITALSAVAGFAGTDLLQNKTGLGSFLNTTTVKKALNNKNAVDAKIANCQQQADKVINETSAEGPNAALIYSYVNTLGTTYSSLAAYQTKNAWDYTKMSGITDANLRDKKAGIIKVATAVRQDCDNMQNSSKYNESGFDVEANKWNSGVGRYAVDATGATITALAGGIATHHIMKAKNVEGYTQAQQEWLDTIGSKIHCYVGGKAVANFGDTISIEITED